MDCVGCVGTRLRQLKDRFFITDLLDICVCFLALILSKTILVWVLGETDPLVLHLWQFMVYDILFGFIVGVIWFRVLREDKCPTCAQSSTV